MEVSSELDVRSLRQTMADIVGPEHVSEDEAARRLFSEDVFSRGPEITNLIVAPATVEEISRVVSAARAAGATVVMRGAGMSYTGGYLPPDKKSISIDMGRMDNILAISPEDMTVTVEAGCSWLKLNNTLSEMGLRTPFWGPISGVYSTLGGGISNLNGMFGSSRYGTSSESVIALTVILGDGSVVRTGARGPDGNTPFYRHFGPDLTGLFCGDSGSMGIKAEITLRLIRKPAFEDYATFSFKTGEQLLLAMAEITRAEIAAELCAFDPGLTKLRLKRTSLMSDVKTLGKVVSKEKSIGKGLLSAAKIALAGRNFIEEEEYPLLYFAEGRSAEAVAADMAQAREIAKSFDGVEVSNSIAKVLRSEPFPTPNSVLGPGGESYTPVHAHVSLSNATKVFEEAEALFASMADDFEKYGVTVCYLFTALSTNAITVEPVFYWRTGYRPIHETLVDPDYLKRVPKLPESPEATATVTRARNGYKEIAARYGAAHFQIGRSYPYRGSRDEAFKMLLDTMKGAADPDRIFNPGVLGFPI